MERKEIYDKWREETYRGQGGKIQRFCSENTIKKLDKVNDSNFWFFVTWQEDFLHRHNASSLSNYRSAIVNFLISDEINDTPMNLVSVRMIEDYVFSISQKLTKNTFRNNINYLNNFFCFLSSRGIVTITFDVDSFRQLGEYCAEHDDGPERPLNPKQVSQFRNWLYSAMGQDAYNRELLYAFDMMYYTDFNDSNLESISLVDNVDLQNGIITFGNESISVPRRVTDNIIQLDALGRLGNLSSMRQYILGMRPLFEQFGVENLRAKDIKASWKRLSFQCPVCGKTCEATINDWCAVDYLGNGEIWIVCRECGNG